MMLDRVVAVVSKTQTSKLQTSDLENSDLETSDLVNFSYIFIQNKNENYKNNGKIISLSRV